MYYWTSNWFRHIFAMLFSFGNLVTIGRVRPRGNGKHWQAHLQEMTNYVSACAKALDPLKNPHMVLLGKSMEVIQTGEKTNSILNSAEFNLNKRFSAKVVKLSARFGFLNVQIRNNFKNIIFIACKWSKICHYYVNMCSTCQKEEIECTWVKYLIYAVLLPFQICHNLRVFPAPNLYSQNSQNSEFTKKWFFLVCGS